MMSSTSLDLDASEHDPLKLIRFKERERKKKGWCREKETVWGNLSSGIQCWSKIVQPQNRLKPRTEHYQLSIQIVASLNPKASISLHGVSENLYKIVAIGLLIATVAALFFLRNVGDTATPLLRIPGPTAREDPFPPNQFGIRSEPILDQSTPYSNFRSDRWIVVSHQLRPIRFEISPRSKAGKCLRLGIPKRLEIGISKRPKVALPQGTMVPVNSFNTIYHSSAFWGLMLPVSVSTMASDVLRGYWAQRLLWEIGGYVVVYPPTVHRYDRIEAYPFSEEKDLHVNVGRLINFLVSWRSGKHRLFEKILELSYAMAEEGFWTERDVKFTAAWLQDLLAVRYQQPRLMSLELDRPRANIGHGDRKGRILGALCLYCSAVDLLSVLLWNGDCFYGRIFKTLVILAEQKNADLVVEEGHFDHLYKHLPTIFNRFTSAEGFLFLQDDTILNYWNLLQADKTKLWITDKVSESWSSVKTEGNADWFTKQADMVKKVVSSMPVHFQISYKESMTNDHSLTVCNSEVFYVPRRFVVDFIDLVNLVGDLDIHQKVAIPMFFLGMDSPQNFDSVFSTMIYKQKPPSTNSTSFYSPEVPAIHPWKVSSEQDFIKLIRIMAAGDPLLMELV
ncbi:putative glycosyltransferase STELLO1 [Camellia lanceoleosa]|uniref:Glycosyltransferase STELLO1 n=1 Tax=Camellia lanceoleosa TaxID=1840588 RepID=A0ACC0FT23_9ERIC|nr:putative glycosyltransferase STELLO1 [Camellia lanceoleosa]